MVVKQFFAKLFIVVISLAGFLAFANVINNYPHESNVVYSDNSSTIYSTGEGSIGASVETKEFLRKYENSSFKKGDLVYFKRSDCEECISIEDSMYAVYSSQDREASNRMYVADTRECSSMTKVKDELKIREVPSFYVYDGEKLVYDENLDSDILDEELTNSEAAAEVIGKYLGYEIRLHN